MLIPHLRLLACSVHGVPCIPSRSISTGRPRIPTFPTPPPARRNFERAPLPPRPPPPRSRPNPSPSQDPPPATTSRAPSTIPRRPTNRQIPFDCVFVIDPDTQKLSRTKQCLDALLLEARRQQKGGVVELVASTPEPIVRLTTRSEVEARYREVKRAMKKGARVGEEPKEVQLTWGVGRADLEHKLRKAGRDLEKGYRVVVVVTVKNGHRPSSQREWVAFADEISDMLSEVGEEWKEREVTARTMTLSFRRTNGDSCRRVPFL